HPLAVGRKINTPYDRLGVVAPCRSLNLPFARSPDPQPSVTPYNGDRLAVGRKRDTDHGSLRHREPVTDAQPVRIPDFDRPVVAPRGEHLAVQREGYGTDRLAMARRPPTDHLACGHIPKSKSLAALTCSSDRLTVRRKGDSTDRASTLK